MQGISIKRILAGWRGLANNLLMQFQGDILNTRVLQLTVTETGPHWGISWDLRLVGLEKIEDIQP